MLPLNFTQIGLGMGFLAFLVMIAVGLKTLFRRDPPLHHEFVGRQEYDRDLTATNAELKRHASARKGQYETMEDHSSRIAKLEEQGEAIAKLSAEVTAQGKQLAAMSEKVEATSSSIARFDTKIDRILERLPRSS